jgi:hypothetical protein
VEIVHSDGSREKVGETFFNDLDTQGTYRVMATLETAVADPWLSNLWKHVGEAAYITLP